MFKNWKLVSGKFQSDATLMVMYTHKKPAP